MKLIRNILFSRLFLVLVMIAFASCATTPSQELIDTQRYFEQVEGDPSMSRDASVALYEAKQALAKGQQAEDLEAQNHYAYLAMKHIELAKVQNSRANMREEVDTLEKQQQEFILKLRQQRADQARLEAEKARRELEDYQTTAREERLENAQAEAEKARQELEQLRDQMAHVKGRQTNAGMVLTLSDVVFDLDKAILKAGAERGLHRLSDFLRKHPERNVLIEGFTDAQGSEAYNLQLSERRANAVARTLMDQGIATERITTRGLGEQYPVASNTSEVGRQQNRRVEITILNPNGRSDAAGRQKEAAQGQ